MTTGGPDSAEPPAGQTPLEVGAAAERTSFAWQRSGLGMAGVGALFIRGHPAPALLSVLTGCLLIGAGILATAVVGPWRYEAIVARVGAGRSPSGRWVVLLAAAVLCASVGAGFGVVGLH